MSDQVPAPSDNPMPDVIRDAFLSQLKRFPTGCSVMVAGTGSGKTTAMAQAMLKIEAGVIETGEDAPWLSSNDKGWKCPKKCLAIIKGKEDRARLEEDLYKYLAIYEREGKIAPETAAKLRGGIYVAESQFEAEREAFRDPEGPAREFVRNLLDLYGSAPARSAMSSIGIYYSSVNGLKPDAPTELRKSLDDGLRENLSVVRRFVRSTMVAAFSDFEKSKRAMLKRYIEKFGEEDPYIDRARDLLAPWKASKREWCLTFTEDKLYDALCSDDLLAFRKLVATPVDDAPEACYDARGRLQVFPGQVAEAGAPRPWKMVPEIYGQSLFLEAYIVIMTTRKYDCFYNTVTDGFFQPKGPDKAYLYKAVFIDESDSAYRTLFESSVDDAIKSSPLGGNGECDIFEILGGAYEHFRHQLYPDVSREEGEEPETLEEERRAVLDGARFQAFVMKAIPPEKDWLFDIFRILDRAVSELGLSRNYLYKSPPGYVDLFTTSDFTVSPVPTWSSHGPLAKPTSGSLMTAYVERSELASVNEIVYVPRAGGRKPENRLDSEVRMAAHSLRAAAYFVERIAERAFESPEFETMDHARNSVVNDLFGSSNEHYIADMARQVGTEIRCSRKARGYLDSRADGSLYTRGCALITLENNQNHAASTKTRLLETGWMPEAYLVSQALSTHVFLVSASANLDMVHNWDFRFLRAALGDGYHDFDREFTDRLLELSRERAELIERGGLDIRVDMFSALALSAGGGWLHGYDAQGAPRPAFADPMSDVVGDVMGAWYDDSGSDLQSVFIDDDGKLNPKALTACRVAAFGRQYLAFRRFMEEDGSRSMISFWPVNMEQHRRYLDAIVSAIECRCAFKTESPKLFFPVAATWETIVRGAGDDYEEVSPPESAEEKSAREVLEAGGAAFIVTTYPTAGFSKNIQFKCSPDEEGLIDVFDGVPAGYVDDDCMRDFDTVALNSPTNLLTANVRVDKLPFEKKQSTRMKACLEFTKMYEMGELTEDGSRTLIKEVFYDGGKVSTHGFDSWRAAVAQLVLQASGRICRAKFRHTPTHILLDEKIAEELPTDAMKGKPTTLVYDKIVLAAIARANAAGKPVPSSDANKPERFAARDSNRGGKRIKALVSNLRHRSVEDMEAFLAARRRVLHYPTISLAAYDSLDIREKAFYIDVSESDDYKRGIVGVDVAYRQDSDRNVFESRFDFHAPLVCDKGSEHREPEKLGRISEKEVYLDLFRKLDEFRKIAEEEGFPVEWARNECILNLPALRNLYAGEIGEKMILTVLRIIAREHRAPCPFVRLEKPEIFEKFDFTSLDGRVLIDAKNHHQEVFKEKMQKEGYLEHVFKKAAECNAERVLIANCVDTKRERTSRYVPLMGDRYMKCADGRERRILVARAHGVMGADGILIKGALKGVSDFVFI